MYLPDNVDHEKHAQGDENDHQDGTGIEPESWSGRGFLALVEPVEQPVGHEAGVVEATPGTVVECGCGESIALRALDQQTSPTLEAGLGLLAALKSAPLAAPCQHGTLCLGARTVVAEIFIQGDLPATSGAIREEGGSALGAELTLFAVAFTTGWTYWPGSLGGRPTAIRVSLRFLRLWTAPPGVLARL